MPEFVVEQLVGNATMKDMVDYVRKCPDGCVVEVGVYQGGSALWLSEVCEEQGRELWLYDTFSGIPYQGPDDSHKVGDFSNTSAEAVSKMIPKARVVEGIFPKSLKSMPPVAFAHIDADQYQSIMDSINALKPLMAPGGVMWFDDVGCLEGANKAFNEWRLANNKEAYKAESGKFFMRF